MTKDVISLSISDLLLFRHYISHKITFGAPNSGGVLCKACGAFICHSHSFTLYLPSWYINDVTDHGSPTPTAISSTADPNHLRVQHALN